MPRIISVVPTSANMSQPTKTHQKLDKNEGPACEDKIEACLKGKPFQLAKPLLISMCLFGLLFFNCKNSKWSALSRAYSIFVVIFLWASVVHLFFAYKDEHFGADTFMKIIIHLWYINSSVNATVTYKACSSEQRLVTFLLRWSRLLETNRGTSPGDTDRYSVKYDRCARRLFTLYLVTAWFAILLSNLSIGYFFFLTNMMDFSIAPLLQNHTFAIPMKVIINIVHIYRVAAWVFPLVLFLLMSSVIYKEFEIFHSDLQKAISPDGDVANLEWFRRRHQGICRMVETADDVLSAFNASGIVFPMVKGMLLLYSLVWRDVLTSDSILLTSRCFWLLGILMYLMLIAYGGGYLNHMAHAPLKAIHNIEVNDDSPKFLLQMNMFLNKLTGDSIGLTALDMLVIGKRSILTIAGVFITYFIVLVQFQQPADSVHMSLSNCAEIIANCTLQCPSIVVGD